MIAIVNVSAGPPLPDADQVASALGATWALLAETLQQGWSRYQGGVYTLVTGVPVATLNGVWAVEEDVEVDVVDAGLALVARSDVPYCLEVRPGGRAGGAELAAKHLMTPAGDIPLMASVAVARPPVVDRLGIRELDGSEAALHCDLAGSAFGAPPELLAELITAEVLGHQAVRGYVGEVAGEPVVTAMSVTLGDGIGIFNVATPAAYRRRGYGAAITARAAFDGVTDGAQWAWLQSSEAGYGVYERLGFTTLERWPLWTR
jgi:hypothetical protein